MTIYLDASCLAMLVLQDDGWEQLNRWIGARSATLLLSDFGWGELTSAIGLRVRRKLLAADDGRTALLNARILTADWANIVTTSGDLALATNLVADFNLGLKLPDAIHIATATRLCAILATADRRQGIVAKHKGVRVFNPLSRETST